MCTIALLSGLLLIDITKFLQLSYILEHSRTFSIPQTITYSYITEKQFKYESS